MTLLSLRTAEASGLMDLKTSGGLEVPQADATLDVGSQIMFSDKYLKNNLLAFPTHKKIMIGKSMYYAFHARDFFTIVSIYHLYRSFPRYYQSLLDYAEMSTKFGQKLTLRYGVERQKTSALLTLVGLQKEKLELESKHRKLAKKKNKKKLILCTIGGVFLGATLGVVSGIFVEKYY